jgi:hypothetical protein
MKWFEDLALWLGDQFRPRYRARFVEDLPEQLDKRRIYLVGEEGKAWKAALLCPCGCDAEIQLSLIDRDDPSWRATIHRGDLVTLYPSIWRIRGCRAHFFVRQGRIAWARGTGIALPADRR